jgi:hypothetical protein
MAERVALAGTVNAIVVVGRIPVEGETVLLDEQRHRVLAVEHTPSPVPSGLLALLGGLGCGLAGLFGAWIFLAVVFLGVWQFLSPASAPDAQEPSAPSTVVAWLPPLVAVLVIAAALGARFASRRRSASANALTIVTLGPGAPPRRNNWATQEDMDAAAWRCIRWRHRRRAP